MNLSLLPEVSRRYLRVNGKKSEMYVCVYVCVHEAPKEKGFCEAPRSFANAYREWTLQSPEELHKTTTERGLYKAPIQKGLHIHTYTHFGLVSYRCECASQCPYTEGVLKSPFTEGDSYSHTYTHMHILVSF